MSDLNGGPSAPPAAVRVTEELPDTSMLYRRLLTFGVAIFALMLVWRLTERTHDERLLHAQLRYVLGFCLVVVLTYFTGATIKDWVAMVTALRTKRTILSGGRDKAS